MKQNFNKQRIINNFKLNIKDTGSSEIQIAILSERLIYLTNHLKNNPKDLHSKKGVVAISNKRKKLLNYLKRKKSSSFNIIKEKI